MTKLKGKKMIKLKSQRLKIAELPDHYIGVSSFSAAIEQVISVIMGTHVHDVPVLMPASIHPAVVGAALRTGCSILLLDIDPVTWEFAPEALEEVLEGHPQTLAIIGPEPKDALLDRLKDFVVLTVSPEGPARDAKGVHTSDPRILANLYNMEEGALVRTYDRKLQSDLARSVSDLLTPGEPLRVPKDWALDTIHFVEAEKVFEEFEVKTRLKQELARENLESANVTWWLGAPYCIVKVGDALKAIEDFVGHGIEATVPFSPFHNDPDLSKLWSATPSYPNVEAAVQTHVAVSADKELLDKLDVVVDVVKRSYEEA